VRIARPVLLPALVLLAFALVISGCGNKGEKSSSSDGAAAGSPGGKVFADAGCGNCHTLATAGSSGRVGPNLDELRPNKQRVAQQVRNGGNGMPSFSDKLSPEEIEQVAAFVSTSAGTGTAGKISFKPDDTKVEDCRGNGSCYEQAFGNLAYKEGPKAALDKLVEMQSQDPVVLSSCHPIAHKIGAGGLLHYEGDVGKAFAAGNGTCGSGYYHGLLQWKLAGVSSDKVAAVASSVCNSAEIKTSDFNYYQCNHGLGHGLMLYTGYNLPKALDYCHQLNTEDDSVMCSGGVFMENQSSSFGLRSKWLSNKNLLYPCNSKLVKRQDKLYCYLLITSHILPEVGGDFRKTADWCRKSEPAWIAICFQSYGRDVAGAAVRNPAQMKRLCAEAGSGEKECIFGAVRDVINNNAQDLSAKAFCETVKSQFRDYCFFGIGSILGTQHADAAGKQAACEQFAQGEDLRQCLMGAGGTPG
jgi:mono/diheme cytochrome c family protein